MIQLVVELSNRDSDSLYENLASFFQWANKNTYQNRDFFLNDLSQFLRHIIWSIYFYFSLIYFSFSSLVFSSHMAFLSWVFFPPYLTCLCLAIFSAQLKIFASNFFLNFVWFWMLVQKWVYISWSVLFVSLQILVPCTLLSFWGGRWISF